MLHGMVEVQPLPCLREAVVGHAPYPYSPIANDERAGGLAQAAPQRLGVRLFAQGVNPLARRHITTLADYRASTGGMASMIQPKDGAGVNPMPAFRLQAFAAQGGALAPAIPFTNIPGIHLNDHLIGFQGQFQLRL